MKRLASDIKNVKESLIRMHKYILSKSIDGKKANKVKDFKGVSMATLLGNALDTNIFLFLLSIFLDFIFLFF